MRRLPLLALLLAAVTACMSGQAPAPSPAAAAAPVPLDHLAALKGDYFPITSAETGRSYHIYLRYPQDYAADPGRLYPIVYLLDGDSLFPMLAASHLFLHIDDELPEAIVVGIAYGGFDPSVNRRNIDYDPANGAAAFHRFFRNELLPRVERDSRADPARRILFGQSLGGAFALYSAFTDPDLFWARIASNPSLASGRDLFNGPPPTAQRSDLRLFVASGSRDRPHLREQALSWFAAWQGRTGLPWDLRTVTIDDGTHAADAPRVYRAALRWLFDAAPR
jgi:predicted alpha/beta superfamily hydrolase